jgi:hypothetical protein
MAPSRQHGGHACDWHQVVPGCSTSNVHVLDGGQIPYAKIARFGDLSLEQALSHIGVEPSQSSYRLLEVALKEIADTASMPDRLWDRSIAVALQRGVEFAPLVVLRNWTGGGWSLLDGANRANAYVALGVDTAQAYELIVDRFSLDPRLH